MTTEVRAIFEAHQLPIPTATPRGMDEAWVGSCMPNAIGEICIWLRAQMINTAPPTSLNGAGVGAIHGGSQSRTRGAVSRTAKNALAVTQGGCHGDGSPKTDSRCNCDTLDFVGLRGMRRWDETVDGLRFLPDSA